MDETFLNQIGALYPMVSRVGPRSRHAVGQKSPEGPSVLCAENRPGNATEVEKRVKRRERGIFGPNQLAIAHGFGGGLRVKWVFGLIRRIGMNRAFLGQIGVLLPTISGIGPRSGRAVGQNRPGHAKEVGDHPGVAIRVDKWTKWSKRGVLGPNQCVISHCFGGWPRVWACCGLKIDQSKSGRLGIIPVCPRFRRWDRGSGVLWTENQSAHSKEVRDRPSMIQLFFVAIWVDKREKRNEQGIFGPNQCAIAHGFDGGLGIRACCEPKIDRSVPRRLGIIPVSMFRAIHCHSRINKRAKRHERDIFGPNQCVIAYGFEGGPGVQACYGPKIDQGMPGRDGPMVRACSGLKIDQDMSGRLGVIPVWVRACCGPTIDWYMPGMAPGSGCAVGRKSLEACQGGWASSQYGETAKMGHFWAKSVCYSPQFWGWAWGSGVQWAKNQPGHAREVGDHPSMSEQGIFGPIRYAIAHGFGGWPWVQACYEPKIDRDVPGSPPFWEWARVMSILWTKNQSSKASEVGDHPSVVCLDFCGHLGGQTGETAQTGHMGDKRERSSLIFPTGTFVGVYFSEKLKFAVKLGYTVLPMKGYLFEKVSSQKFFLEVKGEGHWYLCRVGLNEFHGIKRKAALSWQSFRWQETLGLVGAFERNKLKPKMDQGSFPAKMIGEGMKDGTCKSTIGNDHTRCYHGSKRGQAVTIERLSLSIPSHTGKEVRIPNVYYLVLEANSHNVTLRVSLPAQEAKHSARRPGLGAPFAFGEMEQTGYFRAKSVCHSLRFWRWARGLGVLWAKNQLGNDRSWLDKPVKRHEWGIFGPNQCAIAYGFRGGPGVRACCMLLAKNRSGHDKEVGNHSRVARLIFLAIWVDKRVKRRERGIFMHIWCAIAHGFRGKPEVRMCCMLKIDQGVPGRLGIIPMWGGTGVRACYGPKINQGMIGRLGIVPVWSNLFFVAIWVVKWAKQREWRIFKPNRCAIAYGFGGGSRVRVCCGLKIDQAMPGRLDTVPVDKRAKQWKQGIFEPNRCTIAHEFRGGPMVWACCRPKINRDKREKRGEWGIFDPNRYAIAHDFGCGPKAKWGERGIFGPIRCAIACDFTRGPKVRACCGPKIDPGMPRRPNRCAIAHGFGGGPGFRAFYGSKIDQGMPGRLSILQVDKLAKLRERSVFWPNLCAIANGFGAGLGVQACCGPKIDQGMPGRLGIIPVWWTNKQNSTNEAFTGLIGVLQPMVLWAGLGSGRSICSKLIEDKRAKRRERNIFKPNRSRFVIWARGPGRAVGQKSMRHAREDGDHPSVVRLICRGYLGGQTGQTARARHFLAKSVDQWAKRSERGIFGLNWCAIAHGFRGGLFVWVCCGSKIDWGMPGRLGFIPV
ncbi:hypothetical protein FXO37_06170 [Capsicum annuum]|nr:hypothetical protein FXO37_06170 [Capsicum annuum]